MEWMSANWGNLPSVLGLLVSLATLWVAQRAREAAQAARAEVHRKVISDDLAALARYARELATFVSSEQWAWAEIRSIELISELSRMLTRWRAQLPEEVANVFLASTEELKISRQVMSKSSNDRMTLKDKRDLTRSADRIASHLSAAHGRMTQSD